MIYTLDLQNSYYDLPSFPKHSLTRSRVPANIYLPYPVLTHFFLPSFLPSFLPTPCGSCDSSSIGSDPYLYTTPIKLPPPHSKPSSSSQIHPHKSQHSSPYLSLQALIQPPEHVHFTLPAGQEIAALFCNHACHSGGGDAPSPCAQAEDGQKEPCARLEARDNYDDDATLSLDERLTILVRDGL